MTEAEMRKRGVYQIRLYTTRTSVKMDDGSIGIGANFAEALEDAETRKKNVKTGEGI